MDLYFGILLYFIIQYQTVPLLAAPAFHFNKRKGEAEYFTNNLRQHFF